MIDGTNDNPDSFRAVSTTIATTQAHTATLLVESLLHLLVDRSIITAGDAKEVVQVAIDVKHEVAADHGDFEPAWNAALVRLGAMLVGFERIATEQANPA